jgi:hypothetical protein
MADPLESLARRAGRERFFLASVLAAYARTEGLDDAGLAEAVGCPLETLLHLRLCRAPRDDSGGFREDIDRISSGFGLDPDRLAAVVKRGRVAARFEQQSPGGSWLMAARDREEGTPPPE